MKTFGEISKDLNTLLKRLPSGKEYQWLTAYNQ